MATKRTEEVLKVVEILGTVISAQEDTEGRARAAETFGKFIGADFQWSDCNLVVHVRLPDGTRSGVAFNPIAHSRGMARSILKEFDVRNARENREKVLKCLDEHSRVLSQQSRQLQFEMYALGCAKRALAADDDRFKIKQ